MHEGILRSNRVKGQVQLSGTLNPFDDASANSLCFPRLARARSTIHLGLFFVIFMCFALLHVLGNTEVASFDFSLSLIPLGRMCLRHTTMHSSIGSWRGAVERRNKRRDQCFFYLFNFHFKSRDWLGLEKEMTLLIGRSLGLEIKRPKIFQSNSSLY